MADAESITPAVLRYELNGTVQAIELDWLEVLIGRDPTCDICLDVIHLSRQHARLYFENDFWWIEDLHSRNGVFINGLKVERQRLQDGDAIRLGDTKLWFEQHNEAACGAAPDDMPTMAGKFVVVPAKPKTVACFPPIPPEEATRVDPPVSGPPLATSRGFRDPQDATSRDPVDCTVFAPPCVNKRETFMVQVFVHIPEEAAAAAADALEFDEDATRRGTTSLGAEVARGSTLSFELRMPRATIDEPIRDVIWRGRRTSVQFGVTFPDAFALDSAVGSVIVLQNSVPIGSISFKVKLVPPNWLPVQQTEPTGSSRRYAQAFISYASRDRSEVIRRVQMLKNVGISFFQDVLSLEPGERWAQRLYERIDESDVLFLFWSSAARESEWVAKEWRYALERKGDDFIRPVGIEGPPIPEPPDELKHLHFGDPLLYFIET